MTTGVRVCQRCTRGPISTHTQDYQSEARNPRVQINWKYLETHLKAQRGLKETHLTWIGDLADLKPPHLLAIYTLLTSSLKAVRLGVGVV